MSKWFSLLKILIIFLLGGESSYDSIFIFFGYFFNRGGSLDYCHFPGGGTSRGAGGERGKVHEGGTCYADCVIKCLAAHTQV